MARFQIISFALVLLIASTCASQQRFIRTRKLARQEVEQSVDAAAVTPYPSADEIRPEIPFDEAAAAQTPDVVYGPPDGTRANTPDEVYGPPDVDANSIPTAEGDVVIEEAVLEPLPVPVDAQQSARLAVARRARFQRQRVAAYRRAAQLRSLPVQDRRRI